jgi:tetratricopeptide (TPR) repeat protein
MSASERRSWKRFLPIALLLGVTAGVAWWGWCAFQRQSALDLARSDFAAAAPSLQLALARSPSDVAVLSALANGYLKSQESAKALAVLDQWCRLHPREQEPYRLRMALYRKNQQPKDELADALHLLTLNPADTKTTTRAAGLSFSLGQFAEAQSLCEQVLLDDAKNIPVRLLLAELHRSQGQLAKAGKVLDQLLQDAPDSNPALMARSVVYIDRNEGTQAIPLLERLVRLDPQRQRTARYQLVRAYAQAGRDVDAARVQRELNTMQETEVGRDVLRAQPDNIELQIRVARQLLQGSETASGLEMLNKVLTKHPDHPDALAALADYYDAIKEPARAAEHRRKAAASQPTPP